MDYRHNLALQPAGVARVFDASSIQRPTNDLPRIARMFSAPALVLSAWHEGRLIGVSRSLTDYADCCYISDLAVDQAFQGLGIGKELMRRTQAVILKTAVECSEVSQRAVAVQLFEVGNFTRLALLRSARDLSHPIVIIEFFRPIRSAVCSFQGH
jgi:GNAT superfamily N-acetyltransferase